MSRVLTMKANASGPEGSWSKGYQYAVPGSMPTALAGSLVEAGVAEWVEGATEPEGPSPGGRVTMEGPAPEADDENSGDEGEEGETT